MCWIEWKIWFKNSPIFIFRVIVNISSKIGVMTSQKWPKNYHNLKNKNRKILKLDFSFDFADSRYFMYIWRLLEKKIGKKCSAQKNVWTFLKKKYFILFLKYLPRLLLLLLFTHIIKYLSVNYVPRRSVHIFLSSEKWFYFRTNSGE